MDIGFEPAVAERRPAEHAIMDILLDYGLLIFSREEMLEEEVIRCREGKKFEEKYHELMWYMVMFPFYLMYWLWKGICKCFWFCVGVWAIGSLFD